MKGYFKFLFKGFIELFKELDIISRITLIINIIAAPLLLMALNYELIDSIINGPAWAAIVLSYLNVLLTALLTIAIVLSIELYIDTRDFL